MAGGLAHNSTKMIYPGFFLKLPLRPPLHSIFGCNFSVDLETEIRSSAHTLPPAIYTGQSFSILFSTFVTFQVILGQFDSNLFAFLFVIFL